jgi:thiaminase/transcriptional activator TenA
LSKRSFTGELWNNVSTIYEAITNHPFIQGLTDGSLDEEKFRFYVIQDALYLSEFARALSIAAAKAPNDEWVITFNEHSRTAIVVERSLHESFFKDWGLEPSNVYSTPMSPTNLAYTTYLTAIAYSKPFHELLGALLPCYWLYWEVGKELEKRGSMKGLYQRWIATYSSEEYGKICQAILSIVDTIGSELTERDRAKVTGHFVTTSRYEYMFWDSAYRLEEWPV